MFLDQPVRISLTAPVALLIAPRFRPTGGAAALILFFFLNLNPHKRTSLREQTREFDFFGLFLIIAGVLCLLLGFNYSQTSCKFTRHILRTITLTILTGQSPQTIALICIGGVLLVAAAVWEAYTSRSPILPPRLFQVCLIRSAPFLYMANCNDRQGRPRSYSSRPSCTPSSSSLQHSIFHFTTRSWELPQPVLVSV